jgi:hypothetical protein
LGVLSSNLLPSSMYHITVWCGMPSDAMVETTAKWTFDKNERWLAVISMMDL